MSANNPHHGAKVTTDPAGRQNVIREAAGPVASDSLAAESTRQGGGFAENRGSAPLAVKGANSTFNTTDTSGAVVLPPAIDAAHRPGPEEEMPDLGKGYVAGAEKGSRRHSERKEDDQGHQQQGQSHQQPQNPTTGQRASAGGDISASGDHTTSGSAPAGKDTSSGHEAEDHSESHRHGGHGAKDSHKHETEDTTGQPGPAPTYVQADILDQPLHAKPKGRNLTEGGFEEDAPNASFNAEIGSEDDPSRVAELRIQAAQARSAHDPGSSLSKQTEVTNDGQYKALDAEQEA